MITYYYKNGERVSAEEYLNSAASSDAARKNKPIIEEFNNQLWEKAREYYDRHPKEKEKIIEDRRKWEWADNMAEAYSKTEEGEKFAEEYFKKHPLTSPQQVIARAFWIYAAIMAVLLIALIYNIVTH